MLPAKKIAHYKQLIDSRMSELERILAAAAKDARSDSSTRQADPADQAAAEYERQAMTHKAATARQLINTLKETRELIDRGDFGQCAECGDEIEARRLEVIPWARYCVRCQQAREQS
jgi:RNA polymerase-binding transcription factor